MYFLCKENGKEVWGGGGRTFLALAAASVSRRSSNDTSSHPFSDPLSFSLLPIIPLQPYQTQASPQTLQLEPCNCPWLELDSTLNHQSNLCLKKKGLHKETMREFACGNVGSIIANSSLSHATRTDKWKVFLFITSLFRLPVRQ